MSRIPDVDEILSIYSVGEPDIVLENDHVRIEGVIVCDRLVLRVDLKNDLFYAVLPLEIAKNVLLELVKTYDLRIVVSNDLLLQFT